MHSLFKSIVIFSTFLLCPFCFADGSDNYDLCGIDADSGEYICIDEYGSHPWKNGAEEHKKIISKLSQAGIY